MSAKNLFSSQSTISSEENWQDSNFIRNRGYSWLIAGLVTAGDLAGAGFVSLPTAMVQTQFYPGLILILILGALFYYTSYLLGECWVILLRKWPEYRAHCRRPYAEIGKRALGPDIGMFVSAIITVTQFGICVVYLLIASNNIQDFMKDVFAVNFSFCFVILIVGLLMLPLIVLKSPADFWWVMIMAMISTSLSAILISIGSIVDYETCHLSRETPDFNFINYFLALGTILFAYGGHAAYPTIQHDMKKPHEWKKSSALSYAIAICMYVPPSILGYLTYGDSLRDSVINSLQIKAIQQCVNIFVSLHVILSLTIMFNPVHQEAEDFFDIPQGFSSIKVRFLIMLAAIFIAESVPSVGPIMNIVGSTGITIASTIFPALFYLYLSTAEMKQAESASTKDVITTIPRRTLVCCLIIVFLVFGIIVGSAATFTSIQELAHAHLVPPCYLAPFLKNASKYANNVGDTNCCGHWQNISRYATNVCSNPDMSYFH